MLYSDVYNQRLTILKSAIDNKTFLGSCPHTWFILLNYLGVQVTHTKEIFPEDYLVKNVVIDIQDKQLVLKRSDVESLCSLRPETNEALWRSDNIWKTSPVTDEKTFHVGTLNSYGRSEFKAYLKRLFSFEYTPMSTKALLLPCSADKPYPSQEQAHILKMYPDYDVLFISGYLGVTPIPFINEMPFYDASIPNYGRVFRVLQSFLKVYSWLEYVSYVDFYGEVVKALIPEVVEKVPYKKVFRHKYADLLKL